MADFWGGKPCEEDGCGIMLDFARTAAGKRMPVDRDSAGNPGGNLAVWRQGGRLMCRVLRKGEDPGLGETWGTAHFVTCKNPERFRRPRP
jgi:hypothetical protein